MNNKIIIGADIEVFLYDKKNKKCISAIDIISGTKKNPLKLTESGFAVSHDNVLAEFNIEPAINRNGFIKNIYFMLEHIPKIIPDELTILTKASANYNEDQLKNPLALEFGCEPDFNVYSNTENKINQYAGLKPLRCAGFHVHIGFDNKTKENQWNIIKMMDLYLGVPSVLIDKDIQRRKLYGKAGAFRPTEWGVEYRVLSGFFASSVNLIGWVYDNALRATEMALKSDLYDIRYMLSIINSINNNNKSLAMKIIKENNVPMPNNYKQFVFVK